MDGDGFGFEQIGLDTQASGDVLIAVGVLGIIFGLFSFFWVQHVFVCFAVVTVCFGFNCVLF